MNREAIPNRDLHEPAGESALPPQLTEPAAREHVAVRFLVWAAPRILPRSVFNRLKNAFGESVGLFRTLSSLATGSRETFQLLDFAVRFTVSRRFPGRFSRAIELRLAGAVHVMSPDTTEIYSLEEIYLREHYDRHSDFITQPGWTVFDAGANVGVFTIRQALRGGHVWAFEPNASCYRRLRRSIEANHLSHSVTAINAALGAVSGIGHVVVPGDGHWTTSGQVSAAQTGTAGPGIQILSLDDVTQTEQVTKIDLLKVDVEGDEVEVLRGAKQTLSRVTRAIVEFHSSQLRADVVEILKEHGFTPALEFSISESSELGALYFARTAADSAAPLGR